MYIARKMYIITNVQNSSPYEKEWKKRRRWCSD